jgi:hypothetical protein
MTHYKIRGKQSHLRNLTNILAIGLRQCIPSKLLINISDGTVLIIYLVLTFRPYHRPVHHA